MSTERDTHFQGFAKLLWEDIIAKLVSLDLCIDTASPVWDRLEDYPSQLLRDGLDEIMQTFIAERAYDLEQHILQHVNWYDPEESDIPDMTEWPEQKNPLQGKGEQID